MKKHCGRMLSKDAYILCHASQSTLVIIPTREIKGPYPQVRTCRLTSFLLFMKESPCLER